MFNLIQLQERFISFASRKHHYDKHYKDFKEIGIKFKSQEQYQHSGQRLANKRVDWHSKSNPVVGYITMATNQFGSKLSFAKYNKDTGQFVVYFRDARTNQPVIISHYTKTPRQYQSQKYLFITNEGTQEQTRYEYIDELPEEQRQLSFLNN